MIISTIISSLAWYVNRYILRFHEGSRAFYLLDNKYEPNITEPQGQNLIKEWHIEDHVVLITSDYKYIKDAPYPVFDKLSPEF